VNRTAVEQREPMLLAVVLAITSAFTSAHMAVSTNVPQAQAAIDRGLFFYYAYNGEASAHAFAQAAALDAHLAMAYWGVALAEGPDLNTPIAQDRFGLAAAAITKARVLDGPLPPMERSFIEIMALRYRGTFADWSADDAAYRQAMLELAQSSHDQNAQLLAAEALLEDGGLTWAQGAPAGDESRQALELVTGVLRDDPRSVMANHLCIHLYDLAPDRTPALPCAQRLDATDFPPEAEHLAHMPAHYWIETGNYAAAVRSSERAYALLSAANVGGAESPHDERYSKHDVSVGYSAAMMLGNYAIAQRWAHRMYEAFGVSFDAITALRFGRYGEAYRASGSEFAGTSVRGLAALHLDRNAEARALGAALPAASLRQGYMPALFLGELAEANERYDEAQTWLERSLANQRADFSAEMIPLFPAGEALGALELRRGDAAAAIAAYNDVLTLYPNDPRALFGLAQALAANGQSAQAAVATARFENEWKGADIAVQDALP
jgi:tetratricopeptide (TPR) repeat protein